MNRAGATLASWFLVAALTVTGCGAPDVQPVNGGPPIGPVTSPRPMAIDWANSLCTTLDPLFAALTVPPTGSNGAAELQPYVDQVAAARLALRDVDANIHTVGAAPDDDGQVLIGRVAGLLAMLDSRLDAAAAALRAAPPGDEATADQAVASARSALRSFDRDALDVAMKPDVTIRNALGYAPACARA